MYCGIRLNNGRLPQQTAKCRRTNHRRLRCRRQRRLQPKQNQRRPPQYQGNSFGIGVSGSISGQSLGQTAPTADSRIQTVAAKNGIDSSIGYGSDGGSQSSITKSGIGTRNIVIGNDTDGTQAAAVYTGTRSETAEQNSGRLNNTFDKDKVQHEIDSQRKVSQEFSKNVQEVRTEINRKAEGYKALAKAAEDKAAQALQNGDLNAYREAVQTANEHHQKADNWQKGGVALAAVATGLSAPTDSALGIAAATASPAAAYQIGQYFKELAQQNSDGKLTAKQETAHILAHTVLGAATAAAGDNNALAGAISAGSAEAAAPLIGNYLYGEKDGSKLTAEQKETVTAITNLLGTATGAAVGNSTANAVQGSLNADSAVENNGILDRDGFTPGERNRNSLIQEYGTSPDKISTMIKQGKLKLTKELADYLYTINKNPNLIIEIPDSEEPLRIVLLNKESGWRPNLARPNEEIHDARVTYTSFGQWAIFGKVIVSRDINTGKLRIIPDRYDFEMQKGISKIPRNIETFLGSPGSGTPFKIDFKGEILIE
ncbi:VENN motif pre-toxin domain-containing protein [Neisseria yangbaofengii]|uniref:VENN motif pre-toxin domain-containing protein n=2 Tax=Neisseria yangbaofengii TaxID=2709396 RepID=UPI003BA09FB0